MVPGGRLPRPAAKIKSILVGSVIQILRYYFLRKRVSKLLPAAGFTFMSPQIKLLFGNYYE